MPKCLDCDKIVSPAHAAIHPGHRVVALSQNPKTRARIESQISNQVAYSKLPEELKKSQRAKAEARYRVKNGVPRKSFADMLRKSDAEQYLQNGSKQSHHVEGEPTSVASMRISVTPPGVHGDVGKKLDAGDWKVMFIVLGGTAALTAAGILVSQARDWINGL